jgi:basic membrane protein A and related proteins
MKATWKLFSILGSVMLLAGSIFGGAIAQENPIQMAQTDLKVGLILDTVQYDNSVHWNDVGRQGMTRAITEFDVVTTEYLSGDPETIPDIIEQCVAEENDLCIGLGWFYAQPMKAAAEQYPAIKFVTVDGLETSHPDNFRTVYFRAEELGFLAGTAAGLMTETNIIGVIPGIPIPPVDAFVCGYELAAQLQNSEITITKDYTGNFINPADGAQIASAMIDDGADVIYHIAGAAGLGALMEATSQGIFGIGVDYDTWKYDFEEGAISGSEYVLTSSIKRLDNAIFNAIEDLVNNQFTSGQLVYSLANDGLELAPPLQEDPSVPQALLDGIAAGENDLIDGSINLSECDWLDEEPGNDEDACPLEDAIGFDADADGCIDTPNGAIELVLSFSEEDLAPNQVRNLTTKIGNAIKSIEKDKMDTAINQLEAFINHIEAQRDKKISIEAADLLIAYAQNIIAGLEDGGA